MRKLRNVFFILILVTVGFIWYQSTLNQTVSYGESEGVFFKIRSLLILVFGEKIATVDFTRKLAHFVEFSGLGFELLMFEFSRSRLNIKPLVNTFICGVLIAFCDETIQIFSGRGPMIKDVWLDSSGVLFGMGITLLIIILVRKIKCRTNKQ